jgi:hypothetical protein
LKTKFWVFFLSKVGEFIEVGKYPALRAWRGLKGGCPETKFLRRKVFF